MEKDDGNKNNLNNFVEVDNVSNLSIMSDFSELFGESNLQVFFFSKNKIYNNYLFFF